jgi:hypothetical protein
LPQKPWKLGARMKLLFNEAERFLIEKWADARQLEDSLDEVRKKYQEIGQRIVAAVAASHRELDVSAICLTQYWGNGYIGLGNQNWPDGGSNSPSGLYVDHLRLEYLTSDEEERPTAYIWVAKSAKLDPTVARSTLEAFARSELSDEEYRSASFEESGEVSFSAPSKAELLSALLIGDGQSFVDLIAKQFEGMARFIPALNKLLLKVS